LISEKLVDIDHAEHLIKFREIMESDWHSIVCGI
jgi:hypothetical protein